MRSVLWERLGVISDEVSPHLTEALDWIQAQKLKHVEIRMVDGRNFIDLSDEEIERLHQEVLKRDLFVSALASPLFKCPLSPDRPVPTGDQFGHAEEDVESHFRKLTRAFDIANMLDTKRIRIFSFWREAEPVVWFDEICVHLRKAARMAERAGMTLLLENEGACNGKYAAEVVELIERIQSPAMRMLWDPGNEEYGGRTSFPAGYALVRNHCEHVHLKHLYVAKGRFPLLDQLEALQRDQYNGLFSLETHYTPPNGTKMDGTLETVKMLQSILGEQKR